MAYVTMKSRTLSPLRIRLEVLTEEGQGADCLDGFYLEPPM